MQLAFMRQKNSLQKHLSILVTLFACSLIESVVMIGKKIQMVEDVMCLCLLIFCDIP